MHADNQPRIGVEALIKLVDQNWSHIRIHSCGFWENLGWDGPGRWFELNYLTGGSQLVIQDGQSVQLKQNDLLAVQDTLRNSSCTGGQFRLYYIGFYSDKTEINTAFRELFAKLKLDTRPMALQGLQQDYQAIMADLNLGRQDSVLVKQHFLHLLLRIYHGAAQTSQSAHYRLIHAVMNDLHERVGNTGERLLLSEIAARYSLNERYLNQLFKQETGVTIGIYMNAIRLEQAKRLLETTSMPITAIAHAAGFYDGAHFSRTFKVKEGVSPQEYRAMQRRNTLD
ncbi:helix-turn-helix domain-containing protein [Paenibacillus sp. BC26]|uniref:helix-turn-helix domain-containing protein n=1 Tax=Paenibacillus sp. BC26 TaxID=1881032 RepID=UPI0008E5672F|nr:AraC family transcriptional regulator [Paenibacillus sp. BC26]SFS50275.1 Helix-turn-helix domain-containing protein [Paenibacillus sp. BC26]